MTLRIAAAMVATLAAAPALAQDGGTTVSVAVTAGTLGIGPEVGVRLSNAIGIRGNATFLGFGASFDSDDLEYDADLKLKSFGAMLDVYPFGGSFRLSGGARINRNRVEARATPTGTVEVGGEEYSSTEIGTLSTRADVKRFSPALTLGWGGSNRSGFMFGLDAGVLFQGAPRLREIRSTGTLQADPGFRASLEQERLSLQDDVDKVKVYPILQVAIGYRF